MICGARAAQRRRKNVKRALSSAVTIVFAGIFGVAGHPSTGWAAEVPVADQEYIWVAANVSHPFYAEGKAGWDAAAKSLGVKAQFVGPENPDVQQQIALIEAAIAKPTTAGIVIYSVNDEAIEPVLNKARAAGIPVIAANGEIKDHSARDAYVGTANTALGATAADLVGKALNGRGKAGIVSFITAQNHQERVQGFKAELAAKFPAIEVVGIASEDGTPQSETTAAATFLQAHPDVNLLWTTDAGSGFVAQVIKDQGLQGRVLAVGTDRTAEQLAAIKDGTVYATVVQDTFAEEWTALYFLYWKYNRLSSISDTCITRPAVITKDNVSAMQKPFVSQTPPKDVSDQSYVWVAANIGDPFYTDELRAWASAVKDLGVKPTTITGPVTQDVPAQIAVVEQAIANPTTAGILMGAAIDYKSTDTVLEKARAVRIPTLYGNGQGEESSARDAFVGTDNVALGRKAAELAIQALKGKGNVGITAITAALNIQQRMTGFTDYLKANAPDIHIVAVVNEDGSAKSQTDAANNLLQAHPDLNLVYNTDDSGSLFIAQVLKEQGLTGKVQVIGTNAAADQLPTLKDGEVYANVTQDLYAEEWISLHFLFWLHNKMTTVPDTCYGAALVVNKDTLSK
jgi:ribose transport system substrate-binding protein